MQRVHGVRAKNVDGAFQPEEWSVYREEKRTINDLKGECAISCCSPAKIHKKIVVTEAKTQKPVSPCVTN